MVVRIVPNEPSRTTTPVGKLADAELVFEDGVMGGLKLLGFAVWERRTGKGRNVTFPARQVHRERRASELLAVTTDLGDGVSGRAARAHPAGVRRVRGARSPRTVRLIPLTTGSASRWKDEAGGNVRAREVARAIGRIEKADGCRTAQLEDRGPVELSDG